MLTEEEHRERAVNFAANELIHLIPMQYESYAVLKQYLNYLYTIGFNKGRQRGNKGRERPVEQILYGKVINEYPSVTMASRSVGVSVEAIRKVITGKQNSSAGYFWRYKTIP